MRMVDGFNMPEGIIKPEDVNYPKEPFHPVVVSRKQPGDELNRIASDFDSPTYRNYIRDIVGDNN